jgi:two-component system response regulator MprA
MEGALPAAGSVLVVEDDSELLELLLRGLREEGLQATGALTGHDALMRAEAQNFDVMIIDVGLPDADGRDVCQAMRSRGMTAPVLFLTARDAVTDRLSGFAAGADDYVTKPFVFEELIARLRVWLRRSGVNPSIEIPGIKLDPVRHSLQVGDKSAKLTPTEFRLLAALAGRRGETLRRGELIAAAWPSGAVVHANTLDVYIGRMRRKLERVDAPLVLTTTHGVGYTLE